MTDREKVIEHITDCVRIADCHINHNWVFVRTEILKDALALLKEQEPNTRRWVKEHDRTNHWHCSCCGCVQGITARVYRYCPNCGAKNVEE